MAGAVGVVATGAGVLSASEEVLAVAAGVVAAASGVLTGSLEALAGAAGVAAAGVVDGFGVCAGSRAA